MLGLKIIKYKTNAETYEFFQDHNDLKTLYRPKESLSLSPSSLSSASNCPAYLALPRARATKAALDGNKAHDQAFYNLANGLRPNGGFEPEKNTYEDYIIKEWKKIKEGIIFLEWGQLFEWSEDIHTLGFADCVLLDTKNKTAKIIDYKSGKSEVSAEHNLQLQLYAVMFLFSHAADKGLKKIELVIWQDGEKRTELKESLYRLYKDFKQKADYFLENKETFVESWKCMSCFKQGVCPVFFDTLNKKLEEGL